VETHHPTGQAALREHFREWNATHPILKLAICKDQARYERQGINLRPNGTSLDFAATAGTRLAIYHSRKLIDHDIIVPEQFVDAVLKINPTGEGTINVKDGIIVLSFKNLSISSKLIEGTFPNWRNVIPKKGDKVLSCNKSDFINAIKTCSIFTDKGLPGLKIAGNGKTLTVTRGNKAKVTLLGSELSGQPDFEIQFNSRHMLDTLNVLQNDDVRIQCVDETTPMLIEENSYKEVLVAVHLKP
jgi:DNA polymerase-3 subunit beta